MKKKKASGIIGILLTVCLFLSAAPLGGFVGLESESRNLPAWLSSAIDKVADLLVSSASSANADIFASDFASGTGTQADPYCIATAKQLNKFSSSVNNGNSYTGIYIKLTADISLNNTDNWTKWGSLNSFSSVIAPSNKWQPIGAGGTSFGGYFDGNGYVISGLYYNNSTAESAALFSYVSGTLTNVTLEKSFISGDTNIAGIVANNYGAVINCCNAAVIKGNENIGGIAGINGATLRSCRNSGKINGYEAVGGIAGYNAAFIKNSCNTGALTGTSSIGGIAGINVEMISCCYNSGTITGTSDFGGITGEGSQGIESCYYSDTCVSGTSNGYGSSLTAEQRKEKSNFRGFDFDNVWTMDTSGSLQLMKNLDSSQGGASALWDGSVAWGFASGSGTESNPYLIETAEQLAFLAQSVNSGTSYENSYIRLENDITLNDNSVNNWVINASPWTPIGTQMNPFCGNFDGNGYKIYGVYTEGQNAVGFFGYCDNSVINSVGIYSAYINGINEVGGIVGHNSGVINGCYFSGDVDASGQCGGIVGYNDGFCMINVTFGTVSGSYYIGGICGYNDGELYGGINSSKISGFSDIGSIAGCNSGSVLFSSNIFWGEVKGNVHVGGIAGFNAGAIDQCENSCKINGALATGGIAGYNEGSIKNSKNNGMIIGSNGTGGLCGYNYATIINCYNDEQISGGEFTGGLVGYNTNVLSCSYNVGFISGTECGGVVGYGEGFVTDCYFLNTCVPNTLNGGGTALTKSNMSKKTSYPNFDFTNTWAIAAADSYVYPQLIWFIDDSYGADSAIWDGTVASRFASGSGTKESPYVIKTAAQLAYFEQSVNSGTSYSGQYIYLANDITLNDSSATNWIIKASKWEPIGAALSPFGGSFDGGGHVIRGLFINSVLNAGFFGYVKNGMVENISIENSYIGGSVAVGGVVGCNANGTVRNCSSSAVVNGCKNVGGVVGDNKGLVSIASNSGAVIGGEATGGVAGLNEGVVCEGSNSGATVGSRFVGGVVGSNSLTVSSCSNLASVSGGDNVGGIVGYNSEMLTMSYNHGQVIGYEYIGGLTGLSNSYVLNSYNSETIEGFNSVGGLSGYNSMLIESCYNIGNVVCSENYGGAVGLNDGMVKNCYYLNTCVAGSANDYGSSITTYGLKNSSNYIGFDFNNVWTIDSYKGYKYAQHIISLDEAQGENSAIWNGDIATGFASGNGSQKRPYCIESAAQLAFLAQSVNSGTSYEGKYLRLENNIALNNSSAKYWILNATPWTPIGTAAKPFNGNFDGNGYVVSGIYADGLSEIGLFGCINKATVKNTRVDGSVISGTLNVGAIAGASSDSTIDSCSSIAAVSATLKMGGLVGENSGTILNSFSKATLSGCKSIGGIAGYNLNTISNCYSSSTVKGAYYIGGIAGVNEESITRVYNTGAVAGYKYIGGIIGENRKTLGYCYNVGSVEGVSETSAVALTITFPEYAYFLNTSAPNATHTIGTSLTESDMQSSDSFDGFDFTNDWTMQGSNSYFYPELLSIPVPSGEVVLSESSISIEISGEHQLNATYQTDGEEIGVLTWSSSDSAVATVSNTGLVSAVGTGEATITVFAANGMLSDTCSVTVTCSHPTTESSVVASTCTENGVENTVCAVCGTLISSEVLPLLSHDFSVFVSSEGDCLTQITQVYKCLYCEETETTVSDVGEHQYVYEEISATCTEDGVKRTVCSVCGTIQSEEIIPMYGHSFTYELSVTPGDCLTPSTAVYQCIWCTETQTVILDVGDHDYYSYDVEPTCTEDGAVEMKCILCGDVLYEEVVPKLDHDFSVELSATPGDCETQSIIVYQCSRCETTQTITSDVGEHQYVNTDVKPTCTTDGGHKRVCSLCGDVDTDEITPKLGHDFSVMLGFSSGNCKTKTRTNYKCSRCEATKTVEGVFGSHKYTSKVTPPTCTERGYTTRTCSVCSNQVKDTYVPASGHVGGTTEKVKAATAAEAGYKQVICKGCGAVISTQSLPKLASKNPGDIDNDGSVSSADARLALRCSVGLEPNMTEAQLAAADVDGDGSVSAADARLILRYSVGLETSFPK